jgi:HK97 family phage prohead protease
VILENGMATPALRTVNRDIPNLSFRAEVSPSTIDVDKRTVELIWTTGARVLRGFWEPYYEELSLDAKHVRMDRLRSGSAPLLNAHSSSSLEDVIGVIESARLDKGGKTGSATVRFDSGTLGEEVFRKVREGILRSVSVGYRVYKMSKIEDGETTTPVYRAVDWEPYEISVVPVGADAGAVMRSAGTTVYPCIFEERAMEEDDVKTNIPPAAQPPAPPAAAVSAEQVRAEERARISRIQSIGRALKRPDAEIQSAIDTGVSLEAFRAAAQDNFADESTLSFGKISAGESEHEKFQRGMQTWILEKAGVSAIVGEFEKTQGRSHDSNAGEFRGLRMVEIARMCLERAGVNTSRMLPMDIVGKAMTHRSSTVAASTGDFPLILENTMHKSMLASYGTTPDTWSMFCSIGSVSDFRDHSRYRLSSFSRLSKINELGEYANKAIPDATKEKIGADTLGNTVGISRKAIINDDMQAFSRLPVMLGRAARLSIEALVYDLLALNGGLGPLMNDGQTLFHATHGNIGTGAAISVASLDADRVLMASQKDRANNEILEIRPSILLLPVGLGGQARVINQSQFDVDVTNKFQVPNKVVGLFSKIVDTARVSGTRRYQFADPSIVPTIEVVFLDGQQQPFFDVDQPWNVDGASYKIRLDVGAGAVDFVGALTNAGA